MFVDNPPPTQADLHFRLLGIPVRVHPMFWLISAIMGSGGQATLQIVVIWIVAVFISILVHEFGHALTARFFGAYPQVVLHGFGGLAMYQRRDRDWRKDVLVTFNGPAAGFLLAALVVAIIAIANHEPVVRFAGAPQFISVKFENFESPNLNEFLHDMLFINIWWGLLNLLPVYPLDGGQISRTLFVRFSRFNGLRHSVILSLITAAAVSAYAIATLRQPYLGLMFGYFAFSSWQELQQMGGGGYGGRRWQ